MRTLLTRSPQCRFVKSKAKAMDPEIARNQNYDDHYANDSEDVHSALLPFHDDSARRARSSYVSAAIKLIASFRHRRLGATKASKYKPFIATAYIPNSRPLRRAGRARRQ